ncbi:alpha/beta fold hydrolase [Pseudomonas vancouverensis]|uniref:Alpha/beta hydrolase n=1 Tax=Pseudomonas vancouverensis TaxID=95300 RepID=A0A1H2NWL2_PSEVA|nr:alpha/beta hydrolase [Pseudomonas vancouverensis]KAB0496457.1 alpha/beta hydrolase [Pseudomonas vancouverensis]TDB64835.1 alpha/beta hydrolase [Pseudomonas vancouverensis]SDV09778.1 Pimeloyl-ACP methyl ester carboxylesterase [Pseudomonas vancouverensis]
MTDLVLLHGGNHGSWCWGPFVEALHQQPKSFERVITLDMPGCGMKRGRDVLSLRLDDVVEELNQDLRSAGVSQAVLLGHSIAGAVLPRMVLAAPQLFSHLVFLACALPDEGQSILQLLGSTLHGESRDHVGWPLDPVHATPQEMAVAMFGQDLNAQTLEWLLSEVSQDTTPPCVATESISREGYAGMISASYIITQRDNILPVDWQRRFAQRACATEVIEIDTAHEPFISHPQLLAEAVRGIERVR